jgi:hypothetical protein
MKKTLLAVVAALFLATGAANAYEKPSLCNLREPPGSGNRYPFDIEAIIKKYIWTFRPPPEYDKPFEGALVVRYFDDDQIKQFCARGSIACSIYFKLPDSPMCILILPKNESLQKRGIEPDEVYRHENGHCNGWPGDHGGKNWEQKRAEEL